jgi:riboflavin kinase / FMN adenylyltransferase
VGLKHLVFGHDHHFGHKREGNFENLKGCASIYNFSLEQLEPVMEGDHRISSSAIREALLKAMSDLPAIFFPTHICLKEKLSGENRLAG